MKIVLQTIVNRQFDEVIRDFDEKLFRNLLPPAFVVRLLRYDGSKPGDTVHLRFMLPWPSDWISRITQSSRETRQYYFVDEGIKLPFGLKKWKHVHRVEKTGPHTSRITDDMNFTTGNPLTDRLLFPVLYMAFSPRRRQYRSYFNKS